MLRWAKTGTRRATRRRLSRGVDLAAPLAIGFATGAPLRSHLDHDVHTDTDHVVHTGLAEPHLDIARRKCVIVGLLRAFNRTRDSIWQAPGEIQHGRLGNIGPVCDVYEEACPEPISL